MITFILLGDIITRIPNIGTLLRMERAEPTAKALYEKRVEGAMRVETEYFSLLDGGEDILFDNFEDGTVSVCNKLTETGLNIGSALEIAPRCSKGRYMHHTVVCRTSAFRTLNIPLTGHFHFENMVYTRLIRDGIAEHPSIIYEWIPTLNGANTWQDSVIARANSIQWVLGKPLLSISEDGMSILDK